MRSLLTAALITAVIFAMVEVKAGSATGTGPIIAQSSPNAAKTTIFTDGDYSVIINLAENEYALTINTTGSGSVVKSPDQATYHYGDTVQLTATADFGWTFDSWYSIPPLPPDNPLYITITGDMTITVTFIQIYHTISGTIAIAGNGLADVQMSGLPSDLCTDVNGFYTATVEYGFSGKVTPIKAGYTFDPNNRSYISVINDLTAEDYNALPADDFNDNRRGSKWRNNP